MARWPGRAVLVAIFALAMPGAAYSAGAGDMVSGASV
jgi:hypothetical protein